MVRNEEDLTNQSGTKTSQKNTGKKLIPKTNRSVSFKDIILNFSKKMGKYDWRRQTPENPVYPGYSKNDIKPTESRNTATLPPGINGSGAFR